MIDGSGRGRVLLSPHRRHCHALRHRDPALLELCVEPERVQLVEVLDLRRGWLLRPPPVLLFCEL